MHPLQLDIFGSAEICPNEVVAALMIGHNVHLKLSIGLLALAHVNVLKFSIAFPQKRMASSFSLTLKFEKMSTKKNHLKSVLDMIF